MPGLIKPAVGGDNNAWGTELNTALDFCNRSVLTVNPALPSGGVAGPITGQSAYSPVQITPIGLQLVSITVYCEGTAIGTGVDAVSLVSNGSVVITGAMPSNGGTATYTPSGVVTVGGGGSLIPTFTLASGHTLTRYSMTVLAIPLS